MKFCKQPKELSGINLKLNITRLVFSYFFSLVFSLCLTLDVNFEEKEFPSVKQREREYRKEKENNNMSVGQVGPEDQRR